MRSITFKKNWNGKLGCDCFTTIRKYSVQEGEVVKIVLSGEYLFPATIVSCQPILFKDLLKKETLIMLDTGTDKEGFVTLMKNFYGEVSDTEMFYVILVKKKQIP